MYNKAIDLYLRDSDVDQAEMYFKKAEENGCLTPPHAYNYGELLVRERNEIERGNMYMDLAEKDLD